MITLAKTKHGGRHTSEYTIWCGIKSRCLNELSPAYHHYGGRGITVCESWRADFSAFMADMGPRPSVHHEVDRIDNDGNYEPGNCRWVTRAENVNNRRNSAYVEWRGETRTIAQWARSLGIPDRTLWMRLNKLRWDVERAMTAPLRADRRRTTAAA